MKEMVANATLRDTSKDDGIQGGVMKKRIVFLFLAALLLVIAVFLSTYKVFSFRENTALNWVGKTEDGGWAAEIHYDKGQQTYSGYVFWNGSKDHFKQLEEMNLRYYDGSKLIMSIHHAEREVEAQKKIVFVEFTEQPKGKAKLIFSYSDSGKKVNQAIVFHATTKHYPFYSSK